MTPGSRSPRARHTADSRRRLERSACRPVRPARRAFRTGLRAERSGPSVHGGAHRWVVPRCTTPSREIHVKCVQARRSARRGPAAPPEAQNRISVLDNRFSAWPSTNTYSNRYLELRDQKTYIDILIRALRIPVSIDIACAAIVISIQVFHCQGRQYLFP